MKKIIFYLLLLIFYGCQSKSAQKNVSGDVNWLSIEEAQEKNATKPMELFVFVHANWCPKCDKLFKQTFTNEKLISELNENFYPVLLNAHEQQDIEFDGKVYGNPNFDEQIGLGSINSYHELLYEIEAKSIPSIVFLDHNLKIKGTEMGFKPASELRGLIKMYNSNY